MILAPTSKLNIEGSDRFVRLSYIFEDDDGSRTGVTSGWLSPATIPTAVQNSAALIELGESRPKVLHDNTLVGFLNPIYNASDASNGSGNYLEPSVFGPGSLTCSFALSSNVKISDKFKFASDGRIEPMEAFKGDSAHVLGEGPVGTMLDVLEYLQIGDETIYPLLRLQRSRADVLRADVNIRNGAMVTTPSSALIGMIVGLSKDGFVYSVAPIADVLAWHRLRFLTPHEDGVEEVEEITVRTQHDDALPEGLDPRVRELVE